MGHRLHEKTCLCNMWTTTVQISQCIPAVWPAPLSITAQIFTSSFYIQNFKPLPTFSSCTCRFESYLVENPEDRFSRDQAQIKQNDKSYTHVYTCSMKFFICLGRWAEWFSVNVPDYRNGPKFSDRQVLANSVDPDPRAAVWSESTMFAIPSTAFGPITLWKGHFVEHLGWLSQNVWMSEFLGVLRY